jgi:hypothetical protein
MPNEISAAKEELFSVHKLNKKIVLKHVLCTRRFNGRYATEAVNFFQSIQYKKIICIT